MISWTFVTIKQAKVFLRHSKNHTVANFSFLFMWLSRCCGNSIEIVRRSLVGRKGLVQREEPFALLASQHNWMMLKQVMWPWSSCFKNCHCLLFCVHVFLVFHNQPAQSKDVAKKSTMRVYHGIWDMGYEKVLRGCTNHHTIDNVIPLITLLAARYGREKVLRGCTIRQQQLAQHIVVGERQTYDLCVWCLPMPTRSVAEPKAKSNSAEDFVWHRCVQIRVLSQYLNLDRLLCEYSPSVLECPIAHMLVCWCDSMLINDMLGGATLPHLSFSRWKRKVIGGRSYAHLAFLFMEST